MSSASEDVSDGQSEDRAPLGRGGREDRETGIVPDTDELISAGYRPDRCETSILVSSRKSPREFAVTFLKGLGEQVWQQKY